MITQQALIQHQKIVTLTKNADTEKYKYSLYGIGFDRKRSFPYPSIRVGRNVTISGVNMSSSTKIDNRKKDILILVKGPTQGLEDTLSAEKMYSINFTEKDKKFYLRLNYNKTNSYLFVIGKEISNVATPLYLGNISKD